MDLEGLNKFIAMAAIATYAGDGQRVASDKLGFYDLEFREGEYYYRDSFAGYLASHGQETVWLRDKPVWMCSYAGGMRGDKTNDAAFAHETFEFLKLAMRSGEKQKVFQPRGPRSLQGGEWSYRNNFTGDISNFQGHEEIHCKNELVFEHNYFGGVIVDGRLK